MRRKKRFNVHSNATIKRASHTYYFCFQCKGICKGYAKLTDELMNCIAANHLRVGDLPYSNRNRTKLHHLGNGSLLPGKKFIFFDRKNSHSKEPYDKIENKRKRDHLLKNDLRDRLEEYSLLRDLEIKISKSRENIQNTGNNFSAEN